MNIATIGIDLAKNVFQLHGVNGHGKIVLRRQIHRGQMRGLFVNLPPCLIGVVLHNNRLRVRRPP